MTEPVPPVDLVGHDAVRERLARATDADKLHHAYLLEGPKGVGKRAVARWLSLYANCEASGTRPCGACGMCRAIGADNHPDVLIVEPDPTKASGQIPVDRIREVVRVAGYHRYGARARFVIIDPAEAMAAPAANALLKTLEEPPEGTHFLLVAQHASALLPTIVSRCQRTRLGPVPIADLTPWLERQGVEDAALVARLADGCPGRALSLAGGELAARREVREACLQVLGGDLKGVFDFSAALTKGSRATWTPRVERLLEVLEDLLRDAVVVGSGSARPLRHADRAEVPTAWAKVLWPGGIHRCEQALADARGQLDAYVTGKTVLDALLTRLATELGPARRAGVQRPG